MTKQLDLHGVRHSEVERLVENFVLLNELPLRIITGNSKKMDELVVNVLTKHKLYFEKFKAGQVLVLK